MVKLSPKQKFKLLCLNNILLEPSFLIPNKKIKDNSEVYFPGFFLQENVFKEYAGKTAEYIFYDLLDKSLQQDFYNTLCLAVDLRLKHNLVYTANAIIVKASKHFIRKDITTSFSGVFNYFNEYIIVELKDLINQVEYFLKINGGKQKMPSILKRSWAKKLATFTLKELYSCKNYKMGTSSLVKLTHAKSQNINLFMQNKKPEKVISMGDCKTNYPNIKTVFYNGQLSHKQLLDNIYTTFSITEDKEFCQDYMQRVYDTVPNNNFNPIDYVKYIDKIAENQVFFKKYILKMLNNCFYKCIIKKREKNYKTLCIVDASYDARYTDNSKTGVVSGSFGTYNNFYLNCLFAILTCKRYGHSDICFFSDEYELQDSALIVDPIPFAEHRFQTQDDYSVGMCSYGIYSAFIKLILEKKEYDNIFIFSNRQVMLGQLLAPAYEKEFKDSGFAIKQTVSGKDYYKIDVARLVQHYKFIVNKSVNIISVQSCSKSYSVADCSYRTSLLRGVTGKEVDYAFAVNEFWNEVDNVE